MSEILQSCHFQEQSYLSLIIIAAPIKSSLSEVHLLRQDLGVFSLVRALVNPALYASCLQVLSADGDVQVGKISKQWSGLAKEAFTDADNFGITFPMDLDVKMKATLLGAVFLIVSIHLLAIVGLVWYGQLVTSGWIHWCEVLRIDEQRNKVGSVKRERI